MRTDENAQFWNSQNEVKKLQGTQTSRQPPTLENVIGIFSAALKGLQQFHNVISTNIVDSALEKALFSVIRLE